MFEFLGTTVGWIVLILAVLGIFYVFGRILKSSFSAFKHGDD